MVFLIGIVGTIVRSLTGADKDYDPHYHPSYVVSPQPVVYSASPCACGQQRCAQCNTTTTAAYLAGPAYMTRRDCRREARWERRSAKYARKAARRGYPVVAAGPVHVHHQPQQVVAQPVQQPQPQPQQSGYYRSGSQERAAPRRASLDEVYEDQPPEYEPGQWAGRRRSVDVLMEEKRH
ncbi:hypothetical protein NKR23_g2590 [Pleurostoma richardsiae]|uniref:Uncharacterized protein n=1 Tax=Pleurostoma richardsiae TaxID=41990 RepID=A0AA38VUP1_9PEZI|nr:hypothetical protein NKR23_g2590 [Pleurostoma richardsiae]